MSEALFLVINLECRRENQLLFTGVSFSLAEGNILQITGPNGCGKTSLLRILCGLYPATQGHVYWRGNSIRNNELFLSELIYVGHKNAFNAHLSVFENLKIFAALCRNNPNLDMIVTQLGLQGLEQMPSIQLSAGQKQRLALARLLISKAKLWLLDEPFTALDQSGREIFTDLLKQHIKQNGMAIFTSHQSFNMDIPIKELRLKEQLSS